MCVCCIGFPGVFLAVKRDGMKEKRERERKGGDDCHCCLLMKLSVG